MARRAHYGFGMRVIATDAKPLPKPEYVAELQTPAWFPEMVKQADVVVAAAPLTHLTRGMFSEAIFRSMKPESFFIALSRGKLFDDMALVRALRKIEANASLDVPSRMEAFFIQNPVAERVSGLFSTHPSVGDRVAALQRFAGAAQA